MKKMLSNEIRKSWIDFFKSKQHLFLEPKSLIPNNDPSLLWINSGVATLKNYFSGKMNPPSNRLVNCQKAIRTNDIYNVGQTARHQTMFEMLGNFSIGDYFKLEAIEFAFELLTKIWEINLDKLWFTVYFEDEVTYKKWIALGVDPHRIIKCGKDRNFWDIGSGPCGACTEIYYDRGLKYDPQNIGEKLILEDIENDRYIEIWNLVFSEFNNIDGQYIELARKNIDTGAGLERIASIAQDKPTNFDTDLFYPIIQNIEKYSIYKYDIDNFFSKNPQQEKINFNYRVIADHLRASVFAIADGCLPSNKDRGYILRRLIRRFMICASKLEIKDYEYINTSIEVIVNIMKEFYPYLINKVLEIQKIIIDEFALFSRTLSHGMQLLNKAINNNLVTPNIIFDLVTTYGFPIEIITEILEEKNIAFDKYSYEKLFIEHRTISNNKKNVIAMDVQNDALLNLNVDSIFDYTIFETISKPIVLFNKDFKKVNKLNNEPGYAIFDITPFYARSGGQECDIGYVNNIHFISNVIKTNNMIHLHYSDDFNLELNHSVSLKIDVNYRKQLTRQHSSEHLLHAALKKIVSNEIKQEGAFKSVDKITFDFNYQHRLSIDQLLKIEEFVKQSINEKINKETLYVTLEEAKSMNASAYFEDVYKKINSKLRLIKFKEKSIELCGGTHVDNTSEIEDFSIIDYYSKGSGSWRIEATSGIERINQIKDKKINDSVEFYNKYKLLIDNNKDLKNEYEKIINTINTLPLILLDNYVNSFKKLVIDHEKTTQQINNKNLILDLKNKINSLNCSKKALIIKGNIDSKVIKELIDNLINENINDVILICNKNEKNTQLIVGTNIKNKDINLNSIISFFKESGIDIKGGGKPNYIQSGFANSYPEQQIKDIIEKFGFMLCE